MKTIKLLMLLLIAICISCNNDDGNQNQAPILADKTIDVLEYLDSDIITTITATDPENDTLTYSIVSQNPEGSVAINLTTGLVVVLNASAFDYSVNQVIIVMIMVSDGVNETIAQLTINILED